MHISANKFEATKKCKFSKFVQMYLNTSLNYLHFCPKKQCWCLTPFSETLKFLQTFSQVFIIHFSQSPTNKNRNVSYSHHSVGESYAKISLLSQLPGPWEIGAVTCTSPWWWWWWWLMTSSWKNWTISTTCPKFHHQFSRFATIATHSVSQTQHLVGGSQVKLGCMCYYY